MHALRTSLSVVLILVGLAATAFAVPATWMNTHLLDTEEWTASVGPLIAEEDVQATVTRALVTSIDRDGQLPGWGRDLLTAATAEVVATEAFAVVWADAVRIAHLQLVEAIRGDGTGIEVSDEEIAVDLASLHASLVPRLSEAGVPLIDRLPAPDGLIVLDDSRQTAQVLWWAGKADAWAWPAVGVAVAALLLGVAVARRRAWATLGAGLGVTAVAAVGALLWRRQDTLWAESADGSTGRTVVAALTGSVEGWLTGAGALGLGVAFLGLLAVLATRLFGRRSAAEG